MAEDGSHSGTGRWIALATAVVTLVGAAVSAGLVHAKDDPLPTPTPTPPSHVVAGPCG